MTTLNRRKALLDASALAPFARILLTSAFWSSGILKLLDWPGALAEARHFGLEPTGLIAAATIGTQLVGSVLVIHGGRWTWLGAGALGVFTLLATLIAHAWWTFPAAEQTRQLATFLEHLGLIGGLMLAAILAEQRRDD